MYLPKRRQPKDGLPRRQVARGACFDGAVRKGWVCRLRFDICVNLRLKNSGRLFAIACWYSVQPVTSVSKEKKIFG